MKLKLLIITLICVLIFTACSSNGNTASAESEEVPEDYGDSIIVARDEFMNIFSQFENIEITETKTMARTDEDGSIVIEFTYTSDNGDGVYGFLCKEDEYGNTVIIEQGTEVTVDKLINSK